LFKPSLREFQNLAGLEDAEQGHLVADANRWIEKGRCEVVVLSLGAAGVVWIAADEAKRIPAPMVLVRSTVGAGDSLLAGVVLRLQQGKPLEDAVRFGVAAGAATVMNPGTALCRRLDAERLYAQMAGDVEQSRGETVSR
jgi:6-phosphofructokinase 2